MLFLLFLVYLKSYIIVWGFGVHCEVHGVHGEVHGVHGEVHGVHGEVHFYEFFYVVESCLFSFIYCKYCSLLIYFSPYIHLSYFA